MTLRERLGSLYLAHPEARPTGLELRRRREGQLIHHHFSLWGQPITCLGTIQHVVSGSLVEYILSKWPEGVDLRWSPGPTITCALRGGGSGTGENLVEALVDLVERHLGDSGEGNLPEE